MSQSALKATPTGKSGGRFRRFSRDADGASLVEFAFMFPILVMILFIVISLSHMMMIDRKVTFAAQAAADILSQRRQPVTMASIQDVDTAVELMMTPFAPDFTLSIAHVPFRDPGGAPDMNDSAAWRAVINGAPQISDTEAVAAADGTAISSPGTTGPLGRPGDALIMVRMVYTYSSLWLNEVSFFGINIPATLSFTKDTYARPRSVPQITSGQDLYVWN